jgi:hypothetical protein
MKKYIANFLWAIFVASAFFGAIELQKQLTQSITEEIEAKNKTGWCNVRFNDSKSTIECNRISRLDDK